MDHLLLLIKLVFELLAVIFLLDLELLDLLSSLVLDELPLSLELDLQVFLGIFFLEAGLILLDLHLGRGLLELCPHLVDDGILLPRSLP